MRNVQFIYLNELKQDIIVLTTFEEHRKKNALVKQ